MSTGIPYQAYKVRTPLLDRSRRQTDCEQSKRHSRTPSSASVLTSTSPSRQPVPNSPNFNEKRLTNGEDYFPITPPQFVQQTPPEKKEVVQPQPVSPVPDTVNIALLNSITVSPLPLAELLPHSGATSVASSSSSSPSPPPVAAKKPKKPSTFRHIPLRPPASPTSPSNGVHFPIPSSPLRPGAQPLPHSRDSSTSSSPSHRPVESHIRVTSFSSVLSTDSTLSNPNKYNLMPSLAVGTPSSPGPSDRLVLSKANRPPPISQTPSSASTSSMASFHTPQGSSSSTSTLKPVVPDRPSRQATAAPYRPGFQPKGLYRLRTDEFLVLRGMARDGLPLPSTGETQKDIRPSKEKTLSKVERTKLETRFEKLVELHFPLHPQPQQPRPNVANRRASSFFDISSINLSDPGTLFRGMVSGPQVQKEAETRSAEQRITPWKEDAKVQKCPLCSASFHPLSNRKHHCRLCGQIICSLPAKRSQRPQTCSILFVVVDDVDLGDPGGPKSRKIEEVGEGVDYGVRKRTASQVGSRNTAKEDDAYLKGVRVCRECWPVVLRKQYQAEMRSIPTFARLYDNFITLEKQIQDSLPQFQELVLSLSADSQTPLSTTAQAHRRKLLESFSRYDALSKKIKSLPKPDGTPWPQGSSHERVQSAIGLRAGLFLQKNMFPLQSIPRPVASTPSTPTTTTLAALTAPPKKAKIDPDSEIALQLQPLLEQEALLEGFVEEARARRKFEDAKTLKVNLGEIRAEIERILNQGGNEGKARRK